SIRRVRRVALACRCVRRRGEAQRAALKRRGCLYNLRHTTAFIGVGIMRHARLFVLLAALVAGSLLGRAQQPAAARRAGGRFDTLHFRSIGPASMSGRISDLAVYEPNPSIFYVATSHGGVWKTTNAGTTFEAQFQDVSLMSIGDVTVSQSNPE